MVASPPSVASNAVATRAMGGLTTAARVVALATAAAAASANTNSIQQRGTLQKGGVLSFDDLTLHFVAGD
mgnify:CR=1 FL=1